MSGFGRDRTKPKQTHASKSRPIDGRVENTMDIKWALFSFDGRIGKRAYFLGALLPFLAILVMTFSLYTETIDGETVMVFTGFAEVVFSLMFLSLFPLTIWAQAALTVKRLHDLNITGWATLIAFFPMFGFIAFIGLCLINGTDGPNRYGPVRNSRNST